VPWYRRRDYKGNLTEDEKRELDHFRWLAQQPGGKHPADHDLPEEVDLYISKLRKNRTCCRQHLPIKIVFGSPEMVSPVPH
jgi:hypothetical protein